GRPPVPRAPRPRRLARLRAHDAAGGRSPGSGDAARAGAARAGRVRRSGRHCRGEAALRGVSELADREIPKVVDWMRRRPPGLECSERMRTCPKRRTRLRNPARCDWPRRDITSVSLPNPGTAEMEGPSTTSAAHDRARRVSIGFINWAHAIDHYVMLILATVVIELTVVYRWSYAELIALGTPAFIAFGVFSLPAGWLGDRWSRRNMMALFYVGCGVSLAAAGLAPNPYALAAALTVLGIFAAIYHPVGTAMLVEQATSRGRSLAFNGVCGLLGVALAAGITAGRVYGFGWRGAFLGPGLVWVITGIAYVLIVPDDRHRSASRASAPDVALAPWAAATIFALFIVIALSA